MQKANHTVRRLSSPVLQARRFFGVGKRFTRVRVDNLLQPALKVGAANDPLEREAETTAERIVAMPSPALAAPVADPSSAGQGIGGRGQSQSLGEQAQARRAAADDQPSTESLETEPPVPADHQDPIVPKEEDVDTTGLGADDMAEIESGVPEDPGGAEAPAEGPAEESASGPAGETSAGEGSPAEEEPDARPARSGDAAMVGAEGGPAPADVTRRVDQPGSGRPLPAGLRAFMEPRFDKDFSDVRIHDAADDRAAARRIGARAFTHRQHIWIGPGETVENRKLIAHELTHVVQQTKRDPAPAIKREVETTDETGEPEVRRGYFANKAEKYARNVPGYRLISFILGKSPITGDRVVRNATNLLGALLAMVPGGNLLFERLQETGVIQKAFDWISGRLARLNITWTRIKGLISDFFDYLPAWPSNAVRYAVKLFGPIVRDILTFIGEVKDKILEFIIRGALKLAGPWAEKVWGIIKKVGGVISTILSDPIGFAKNLFSAVLKGFRQFSSNAVKHIKRGLLGWLFGAIKGLDIQIPEKLDFKGLISIGLQIVGLTYANFRARLVKRLGANGERKVAYLEKSVEVVKILVKEGFAGLWQRTLQMIDNFTQTIIGGVKDFVINSLIIGGLSWLAGLSNPVGAVIKVVLAIYKIIKTFLERFDQILDVAKAIFSSIGAIASGKIQQAADFIEKTIAATIPVVISFLAALVPITGITNSIRNIIKKLRAPVAKAMDKMIVFLVKKAKKLFSRIIGKLNKKRKLPSASFKVGKAQHRIYAEKKGKSVQVMIASGKGAPIEQVEAATQAEAKKLKGEKAKQLGDAISGEVSEADKETAKVEKKIDLNSKNKNQNKNLKKMKEEISKQGKEIEAAAKGVAENEEVDAEAGYDGPLFRFKEPRDPKVEGRAGTYSAMREIVKASENKTKRSGGSFYEVDHIIEKQIPKAILENLRKLDPKRKTRGKMEIFATRVRKTKAARITIAEKETKGAASFGKIGFKAYSKIAKDAPQFPAIILYRPNHLDEGRISNAKVLGWIQKASQTDDPQAFLKDKLLTQLTEERTNVAQAYQNDADASEAVGKSVNEGLKKIEKLNRSVYDLTGAKPGGIPDAAEKAADARAKSNLLFSAAGGDASNPDFANIEGNYAAFSSLPSGLGKYLEKDHIVEKSFPKQAQGLTFGDDPIWPQIEGKEPKGADRPSVGELKTRKDQLRRAKVYPSSPSHKVQNYDEQSGKALLIYRPIHRAVSSSSTGARGPKDIVPGGAISSLGAAAQAFMKSGNPQEIETMRKAIQPAIMRKVVAATGRHTRKVESEYDKEIRNVKAANAEGGAEAKKLAAAKMQKIINKTKGNLSEARTYTLDLFS